MGPVWFYPHSPLIDRTLEPADVAGGLYGRRGAWPARHGPAVQKKDLSKFATGNVGRRIFFPSRKERGEKSEANSFVM